MKKKTLVILAVVCISAILLTLVMVKRGGKDPAGDNLDNIFDTSENTNSVQNLIDGISSRADNEEGGPELTPEELAAAITNVPALAIHWNIDEEGIVEYNGGELTTEVTVTNGSFKIEEGFAIALNGVLQECVIEYNGYKTERSCFPKVILNENEALTFKISFTPNIGQKGDKLEMHLVNSYLPSAKINDDMQLKVFLNNEHIIATSSAALKLNEDSTQTAMINADYSNVKTDKLSKLLYNSHNYENEWGEISNDTYDDKRAVFYQDLNKYFTISGGVFYDIMEHMASITVEKSEKVPLTINEYGQTGKRRIALLINHELQPVFDGKYYTDIEVKDGQQVELFVEINTSELEKYNNIYVLSYGLNDTIDPLNLTQSEVSVLKIE